MGTRILSDAEIAQLIAERKPLPAHWRTRLRLQPKHSQSHLQRNYDLEGADGHQFRLILRENIINPLNFSILLVFIDEDGSEYVLRRFNGNAHEHTNKVEKKLGRNGAKFIGFHIHTATERYQQANEDIVGYAELTDAYNSFSTAREAFITMNGFDVERVDPDQTEMFT